MNKRKVKLTFIFSWIFLFLFIINIYSTSVPKNILSCRNSVVRVVSSSKGIESMGSGFSISKDSDIIVTNYHVVEGSDSIKIYYDTNKYIDATVYASIPSKDIAILKLSKPLFGTSGIVLYSGKLASGSIVYALGFPGAADEISSNVLSDKNSITITSGIVSSLREGLVGDQTSNTIIVQSNVSLNGGNSGGPLLNSEGLLVGINTFKMIGVDSISGSIHVTELVKVLENSNISYKSSLNSNMLVFGIIAILFVIVISISVFILLKKKNQRLDRKQASGQFHINKKSCLQSAMQLIDELVRVGNSQEQYSLISPDNIFISSIGEIKLRKNKIKNYQLNQIIVYPGITSPETINGFIYETSIVFSIGRIIRNNLRTEIFDQENKTYDQLIVSLLDKACDESSVKRFASLVEFRNEIKMVYDQIPFETSGSPTIIGSELNNEIDPKAKLSNAKLKKKTSFRSKILFISIISCVLIFSAYNIYFFSKINDYSNKERFSNAVSAFEFVPWLKFGWSKEYQYLSANLKIEEAKVGEAVESFDKLGNYKNSLILAGKCRNYLNVNLKSTILQKYSAYIGLDSFADSKSKANDLIPKVYERGIYIFNSLFTPFNDASYEKYFQMIPNYKLSYVYLEYYRIINKYDSFSNSDSWESDLSTILELDKLVDIDVKMYDNILNFQGAFLVGEWFNRNRSISFSFEQDGSFEINGFNMPYITYTLYYDGLHNNKTIKINGKTYHADDPILYFDYFSYNHIALNYYPTNQIIHLYR